MTEPSLVLGIDTSCDETSAAILADGKNIFSNVISSQIALHAPHGGVVPELASRSHLTALPIVVEEALSKAGITLRDLSGIAVTTSPGLIGCLLVGLSFSKSLAYSLKIPFTCVHHLKGHLFSPCLESGDEEYPFLGLVVSGGHTALYYVTSFENVRSLGQTMDDAAGEAYDKVAKLLGLGYPGGPVLDRLAQKGDPEKYSFSIPRIKNHPYAFSFSGIKTAVALLIKKEKEFKETDVAASFQKIVVASLTEKVGKALKAYPVKRILVSGGVAANSLLKSELEKFGEEKKITIAIPRSILCTDNGAMIAYVGAKQLAQGKTGDLSATAEPSAPL